ncbi:18048_t:CDS:1 [Racocetra fulgida]|uniref:18048_t:CDS:1 n=1 Tax=Racocetra fulgida TaxID=60492 RepID=A0A9N8ZKT3_9GLOM|nr:18048_t:CDS:1 [Racocetra fulgida]
MSSDLMDYEMVNKNESEVGTANNDNNGLNNKNESEVVTTSNDNSGLNDNIEGGSGPTNEDNSGNDNANHGLGSENEPTFDPSSTSNPNNPDNISNSAGDPNDKGSSLADDNAQTSQTNTGTMDIDNQNEMTNVQNSENEDVTTNQQPSEPENQNDNAETQEVLEHDKKIASLEAKIVEDDKEIAQAYKNISKLETELEETRKKSQEIFNANHKLHQDNYSKDAHISNLTNEYNKLYSRYNTLLKSLDEVTKKNEELKIEAAHYQSRLGDAKNFKLGDDDPNNSTALTRDIEQLQDKINLYARVKKGVTLNLDAAKAALLKYGCSLDHVANEDSEEKILIKWLLQRNLIEIVTDMMNKYLNNKFRRSDELSRELELIDMTRKMTGLLSEFDKHRDGIDEVTQAAPIKLRQQIYAVLGDRGFADVKDEKKEHPFISYVVNQIDTTMSNFRTFNDDEKKQEIDKLLPSIVREIIKIFFFRLKVQEPEATFRWFKRGDKIDPIQMVGPWDENIDQWFVDICYFPLVGIDLDNENNRKILFQAKVAVYKEKKSGFNKVFNMLIPEGKRAQQSRQQGKQNSSGSPPTTRQNSKSADPDLQGDSKGNLW